MKRFFVLLASVLLACGAQAQLGGKAAQETDATEWNDHEVCAFNRMDARSNIVPYADENAIEQLKYEESPYYVSLNGTWKMNLEKGVNSLAEGLDAKSFSADGWKSVAVPDWQWVKNGRPLQMPQVTNAAELPSSSNYVATYYKEFTPTKSWADYDAVLRMQARSAYYVWVNNRYVGYAEDSRSISEFDITKYLKLGKTNNIIVQVVGVSDGSLLEMNQPRTTNGFTGDVAITLQPKVHVLDYQIKRDYEVRSGIGSFEMNLTLANSSAKGKYYIEVEVWDPAGKEIEKMGKWVVFDKRTEVKAKLEREILSVKPWTSENPNMYTTVVRVRDEKMNLVEVTGSRFGFRHVEMQEGVLTLNGKEITLRGVVYNNYMNDGSALTRDQIRKDLELMKRNNVNALRTRLMSPAADYLYELCDEYGIYVLCDANLMPFSGQSKAVASAIEFSEMCVERVSRMYDHYKNYTSILAWSLGDGLGNGVCMENAFKALKAKDKERPVVYAGAEFSSNSDIIAIRSTDIDIMRQSLAKQSARPMMLIGYPATLGNGFGGLDPVWQLVRQNRRMIGGFLQNWNDMRGYDLLEAKDVAESGIVRFSGQVSPVLDELRELYREFGVSIVNVSPDHYEFNISNYANFSSLRDYKVDYAIYSNYKPRIIEGDVSMSLEPGESKNFKLKVPKLTLYAGEDLFIRFTVKQKRTTSKFVPKDTELGHVTFALPMHSKARQPMPEYEQKPLQIVVDQNNSSAITIVGADSAFLIHYNMETADLDGYTYHGRQLIESPVEMSFSRVATDNDRLDKNAARLWQSLGHLKKEVVAANYRMIDNYNAGIDVMVKYADPSGATMMDVKQTIQVLHSGDVIFNNEVVASELVKGLPRVGMSFALTPGFDTAEWYGMDHETYADRKQSGNMGIHTLPLSKMHFDYGSLQENGNRTDVSWTAVRNAEQGFFVDMLDSAFCFNVQPAQNGCVLTVDHRTAGIGNAVSGSPIDEKYLIKGKKFDFRVHFTPYRCDDNDARDFSMIAYPAAQSGVLPMPVITKNRERFDAPMQVTMRADVDKAEIRYTLDGTVPTESSLLYRGPVTIKSSTVVKARTFKKGATTSFTSTQVYNYDYISSITYAKKPNTPYNYKAESALFDGECGTVNDLSRGWIGFSGSDFEAVLELGKSIELDQVVLRFAHVPETWVFAPKEVDVYTSADGVNFDRHYVATIPYNPADVEMNSTQLQTVRVNVAQAGVKYVKIVARNIGKTPKWHKAKGLPAWIMVDEIQLNEVIK